MTLKEARKKILNLTQEQMAEKLGLSVRTVVRFEVDGAPDWYVLLLEMMVNQHAKSAAQAH